jgi:hypothetical protein
VTQLTVTECRQCGETDTNRVRQGSRGMCRPCYERSRKDHRKCEALQCEAPSVGRLCHRHQRFMRLYGLLEPIRFARLRYCSVEHCYEPHKAAGLCSLHYQRSRKNYVDRPEVFACRLCGSQWGGKGRGPRPEFCKACNEYLGHIQRRYGLDRDTYFRIGEQQSWCCAICGAPDGGPSSSKKFRLVVDHCHDSSEVRGLLCMTCNSGLGMFADNAEWLYVAADYVERWLPIKAPDATCAQAN